MAEAGSPFFSNLILTDILYIICSEEYKSLVSIMESD